MFVPLAAAAPRGEDVQVPVSKEQVRGAPSVEPDRKLSEHDEIALFPHYGMLPRPTLDARGGRSKHACLREGRDAESAPRTPVSGSAGREVSGPTTDDAKTRAEKELRVGTASRERERERGRVRQRQYIVTEEVQYTVPVRARRSAWSANRSPTPTSTEPPRAGDLRRGARGAL